MHKKTFTIEWPEDCGPEWMCLDNLKACLLSKEHTKAELIKVHEVK